MGPPAGSLRLWAVRGVGQPGRVHAGALLTGWPRVYQPRPACGRGKGGRIRWQDGPATEPSAIIRRGRAGRSYVQRNPCQQEKTRSVEAVLSPYEGKIAAHDAPGRVTKTGRKVAVDLEVAQMPTPNRVRGGGSSGTVTPLSRTRDTGRDDMIGCDAHSPLGAPSRLSVRGSSARTTATLPKATASADSVRRETDREHRDCNITRCMDA